jgi:dihydroceramidase
MSIRAEGYWDQFGAPSIVDWCEPNYVVSPYVAEWWNTTSSVPMGFIGFIGMWLCWSNRDWIETRFLINFFAFALVGWGSTAFHGTLLRIPQALDELPMVYSALVSVYILVLRRDFDHPNPAQQQRKWGVGLTVFALSFTIAYWTTASWYFVIFLLLYGSLITYITLRTLYLSYTAPNRSQMVRLCWLAFGSYLGGFFLMWIPEHVIFACEHSFQLIQPHSWFHGTSAVGAYVWILWAIVDRRSQKGDNPVFRWTPAPFIARK